MSALFNVFYEVYANDRRFVGFLQSIVVLLRNTVGGVEGVNCKCIIQLIVI